MLKNKIDALKFAKYFHALSSDFDSRFSLLDYICLLYINEHDECGQLDICEYLFDSRTKGKSSTDRPLARLVKYGLVNKTDCVAAKTKLGNTRVTYSLTDYGRDLLKKSSF